MILKRRSIGAILLILLSNTFSYSQETVLDKDLSDSLYINETEAQIGKPKVLHAEPLYIDLIRDLGARKGEKEWNVGMGLTDHNVYDHYNALVEYEWAPIDRLGLEVELPFSFHYPTAGHANAPGSKLNSLKLAAQYTFLVKERKKLSMALGYINEIELNEFNQYGAGKFVTGNVYNPFYVVAKRWGQNFHTLLYTGPTFIQHYNQNHIDTKWQINTNFHYMIPGTRNFIGVEFNKTLESNDFDMTIRPQMRLSIADNLMIGIVTGIPISREQERFSTFLRLIYEPKHK